MDIKDTKNIPPATGNKILARSVVLIALVCMAILVLGSVYINRSQLPQVWRNVSLAAVSFSSLFFPNDQTDTGKVGTTTPNPAPAGNGNDSATSTLEIIYNQNGGIEAVRPISVPSNGGAVERVAGPKTERTYQIGERVSSTTTYSVDPIVASNPNGFVDLAVQILQTGTVDKTSGQFTATSILKSSDRIAVRFEIKNIGTKASGSWNFSASLPTFPWYFFQSDSQQSLQPGDRIEFTLGFDSVEKADSNVVVINADPSNQIGDNLRNNNIASTTLSGVQF